MNVATPDNPLSHRCANCGSVRLRESVVKSAIWHGAGLVIVEDIPAIVCGDCGERFYDDATATMLELMQGEGFPPNQAVAHVNVPVFSFSHRIPADLVEIAEDQT